MSESRKTEYTPMQTLIRLVSAGARKECINDLHVDWHAVLPLAVEHNLLPLVACALLESPCIECPKSLKEELLNSIRSVSASNLVRRQRIMQLIDELQQAGFDIQILKGYAIANNYAYPESRDSADVDLLINQNQEKDIYTYLRKKGFIVSPRSKTSHHGVCTHSKYGVIEIHAHLYDQLVEDVWFHGINGTEYLSDEPVNLTIDGCHTKTLGYTDQLIFLTLHMIKHFIGSGLTIRMVLDVALFFSNHSNMIDSARFWLIMEKLHYSTLVNCILGIFIRYGSFNKSDFRGALDFDLSLTNKLLQDIECGGYMGSKETNERQDAIMEYNRRLLLKYKSNSSYITYMIKWKICSAWNHMFPERTDFISSYPILKSHPAYLPFLRIYQAIVYPLQKLRSGILSRQIRTKSSSITSISDRRIKFFEELKMI